MKGAAKRGGLVLAYLLGAAALVFALRGLYPGTPVETLSYSEFKTLLAAGKIDEVVISDHRLEGSYAPAQLTGVLPAERVKALQCGGRAQCAFSVVRVDDPALVAELDRAKVPYRGQNESQWLPLVLSWAIPLVGLYFIWMLLLRRTAGGVGAGALEVGKSKARVYVETDTKVTFADVAGADEAKAELQEVVDFLRQPQERGRLGARLPKGVLLVGPPGTGKTLLARAVAGEAGVPFFSINGSEFVELFVGVGAARVRDLFDRAREKAPAIIFIDELDALGRARGSYVLGGHDEKEQTLNQLLSELDGFDSRSGLVLLAATNRPEILDTALLRAGRFDRQIVVDRPDRRGRIQILQVHLRKVRAAADLDLEKIAALTPGFTGADLANLVNEAALGATRRKAEAVTLEDFTAAVERLIAGLERKSRVLNETERRIVAYHELGHAVVSIELNSGERVEKVSIIPRGVAALGYTLQRPLDDRFLMTRAELAAKLAGLLGGRAAEALVFGDVSTGAADDLHKATEIARSMVMHFGMDAAVGEVSYADQAELSPGHPVRFPEARRYSEQTAREIDEAVRKLVQDGYARALAILKGRRAVLDRWAARLIRQETLEAADVAALKTELAPPAAVAPFERQAANES
ncbi:MAG: ATP-dependent zinc metalloprotease FtsH [Nevskia sp.]|nr:ATP-dependent zinc metalloprotease FtsH [Nevskia sp.]